MKRKITQSKKMNSHIIMLLALFFMASTQVILAQTVSEIYPTRVTTKSLVTIVGSGFTSNTTINIQGISIANGTKTLVSTTEMTFEISESGSTNVLGAVIEVGGEAVTVKSIDYIAPIQKTLQNGESSNVTKITEIFTTYNGFWRSSQWKVDPNNNDLKPNTSHDLLAFTYDGVTYSTGVNDALLTANGVVFDSQLFYAYSTNGVDGVTHDGTYLAMADLIDGQVNEGPEITSPTILNASIYEVLIDGINGLDLGTGVTNFNQLSDVEFFSSGGLLGAIADDAPDFLITQIAHAGHTDLYYYTDDSKNVVGTPISFTIVEEEDNEGDALLAKWRVDIFTETLGVNYGVAKPERRIYDANSERPIRMAAFKFQDFGITESNISDINSINMVAGGTSDLAFLAYNRGSFDIKTPVFDTYPISRSVCEVPSSTNISFTGSAVVSGDATGDPAEALYYHWYKYNEVIPGATSNTYTITDDIKESDLGTYKLKVTNSYGSVIVPVSLTQGGTPVYWDGKKWELPPSYVQAGITVSPEERRLVLSSNYNEPTDLEGCDCVVPTGSNAVIPSGSTLKVQRNVTVEPGATLTLEDSANLIQVNDDIDGNANSGSITMKRNAKSANDFIVWSTSVEDYDVDFISNPFISASYFWDVTSGETGNWVSASGAMEAGLGYAVEVPVQFGTSIFTTSFIGVPINGAIARNVSKSSSASAVETELKDWNLIGNPYPSAISGDEFLAANSALNGTIRFYANNLEIANVDSPLTSDQYQNLVYSYSEQYINYNATGENPPQTTTGSVSSGQGFYVQVAEGASAGEVSFTNEMRYDAEGVAFDNSNFFKTNVSTDNAGKQLVWLSLIDASNTSASALLGFVNGATLGKDKLYDTYSDLQAFDIYTIVEDSKMVIQGRPLPFSNSESVAIGVNLPADGNYKIAIGDLSGSEFVDGEQPLFLTDTYLNKEQDLRVSPYDFSGDQGEANDRFVLNFEKTLSIDDNTASKTFVFINNDVLNVKSFKNIKAVNVYDISGKQVISYKSKGQSNELSENFKFSTGVYLVNIVLEGNVVVTKKVIN